MLLNKLIVESLEKSGYTNLRHTENGQEAWDYIQKCLHEGSLEQNVQLVITDIEMPLMDGHRLTKLIKENEQLHNIPVVIFSSLVNEEMRRKGEELGADAQLSKPEIGKLVMALDQVLGR